MSRHTVTYRGTVKELNALLSRLPGLARAAPALAVRLGQALLGRIAKAFVVKADGGTDEAGERWQPLSPYTIAYRAGHVKLGRGERPTRQKVPGKKVRARYAPSYALSDRQRERWWALYRRYLAAYRGDKSHAAAAAWTVLKAEGARTLFDRYSQNKVQILRDTGLLLSSLKPGVFRGNSPPKIAEQVFHIAPGEAIVGTSRKGAVYHHHGIPGRLPQRRLWPPPERWPSSWQEELAEQGQQGVIDVLLHGLRAV